MLSIGLEKAAEANRSSHSPKFGKGTHAVTGTHSYMYLSNNVLLVQNVADG